MVVKFLTIKKHCDPTKRNVNNDTVLHLAVERGHLNIVKFFISNLNCDPNIPGGPCGGTSLHKAAEFGHLHIVKYLIDKQDCNPSCLDDLKSTPLHHAAAKGHVDIVEFLTVHKHCNPLSGHMSALHCAVLGGQLQMVKFLVEKLKCSPDISGPSNLTPLQIAENTEIAQYLQKHTVIPYIYMAIGMLKQL